MVFFPKKFDVKQNFCCNEFNFKLNWKFCAKANDVVKNFAVIKNVVVKRVDCTVNFAAQNNEYLKTNVIVNVLKFRTIFSFSSEKMLLIRA